ncbi:MAG: hypothetical protein HQL19_02520 [Candidatus Omnitrophica bacterium]|nr:hypothetical protein [Candidatus Omnitrophota bacterium]
MKDTGRTLFVFLTLIIIILISGVSISLYFLSKETQGRKDAETSLAELQARQVKVEASLKDAQKEIEVLRGKNKDADEKINSLLDEIELDNGLREEIKTENKKLKENLEAEGKAKIEIRQKLSKELEDIAAKLKDAEAKASSRDEEVGGLQKKIDDMQKKNDDLEKKVKNFEDAQAVRQVRGEIVPPPDQSMKDKVELDRIVVTPDSAKEGKVLNVDTETEFMIFDLGAKHGIKAGDIMSVYRGKAYLGDIKVSRVQEEMSAADFIPPFSSRKVRKNDQVVPKR